MKEERRAETFKVAKSIFEENIAGQVCYTRCVEDRMLKVKKCSDITALRRELETTDLQSTVRKAIEARIRKLSGKGKNDKR